MSKTKPDFELRRVMKPKTFRDRNGMSKTEYTRRRKRQRAGEPGSELLLPEHIKLSEFREGITYQSELNWQVARTVSVPARRQRASKAA
jgi:hypothetical protein